MEEIPKQVAKQLPEDAFIFNTKVVDIQANTIITATGEQIQSDIIIVATEATALISKYKTTTETKHHSVTNVYFEKVAPSNKAVVILNASEKDKIVNNLTVMTNVAQHMHLQGKC
jgi:protoporphyrinogen oxidase